eukprot:m.731275 g.731275  ORF g.731275 m.731275 type:complete len:454 (-) comp23057_c0_seq28:2979-4340(-)
MEKMVVCATLFGLCILLPIPAWKAYPYVTTTVTVANASTSFTFAKNAEFGAINSEATNDFGCSVNMNGENVRHITFADVENDFSAQYDFRSELYNPALVCFRSQLWLIGRHEGRNQSGGWVDCPEHSLSGSLVPCPDSTLRMVSFVVRLPLTTSLIPAGMIESLPYMHFPWTTRALNSHERQLGPEDPRVMHINSDVWVATNGPPIGQLSNTRTIRCMKIQQIFPVIGRVVDLDITGDMQRIEKNWSPIVAENGTYLFSRYVEPHQVIRCTISSGRCTNVAHSRNTDFFTSFKEFWKIKDIHLGTNAVKLPTGKYLAIFHGLSAVSSRSYLNFAYTFAAHPPWKIEGVAATPLELPNGPITSGAFVFSTNIVLLNATQAIISYTVKDRTASFASMAVADILRNIKSISKVTANAVFNQSREVTTALWQAQVLRTEQASSAPGDIRFQHQRNSN